MKLYIGAGLLKPQSNGPIDANDDNLQHPWNPVIPRRLKTPEFFLLYINSPTASSTSYRIGLCNLLVIIHQLSHPLVYFHAALFANIIW